MMFVNCLLTSLLLVMHHAPYGRQEKDGSEGQAARGAVPRGTVSADRAPPRPHERGKARPECDPLGRHPSPRRAGARIRRERGGVAARALSAPSCQTGTAAASDTASRPESSPAATVSC